MHRIKKDILHFTRQFFFHGITICLAVTTTCHVTTTTCHVITKTRHSYGMTRCEYGMSRFEFEPRRSLIMSYCKHGVSYRNYAMSCHGSCHDSIDTLSQRIPTCLLNMLVALRLFVTLLFSRGYRTRNTQSWPVIISIILFCRNWRKSCRHRHSYHHRPHHHHCRRRRHVLDQETRRRPRFLFILE